MRISRSFLKSLSVDERKMRTVFHPVRFVTRRDSSYFEFFGTFKLLSTWTQTSSTSTSSSFFWMRDKWWKCKLPIWFNQSIQSESNSIRTFLDSNTKFAAASTNWSWAGHGSVWQDVSRSTIDFVYPTCNKKCYNNMTCWTREEMTDQDLYMWFRCGQFQ